MGKRIRLQQDQGHKDWDKSAFLEVESQKPENRDITQNLRSAEQTAYDPSSSLLLSCQLASKGNRGATQQQPTGDDGNGD